MRRAAALPKAPALCWPWPFWGGLGGQKMPAESVFTIFGSVRSGFRLMASAPMNPPSSGGQSSVVCFEPTGVHGWPERLPELHTPPTHFGHGEAEFAVR